MQEHPKFIPALNNLAYTYAIRYPSRKNLDKALNLLKDIPEKFLDANTLDTVGWVYYKRKNYTEAIEIFKQAESMGDAPILHLNLGLTYLEMNQTILAKEALEKALKDGKGSLSEKDKKLAKEALKL